MSTTVEGPRLTFLDNLRWIMIARVVLFHVGAGYSGLPEFYIETQAGGAVGIMRNIIAALPGMNVLFFVAGFFALPSLQRRGYGSFVRGKLYRLGIPYLLCVFFLGPLMPFLGFYSQSFSGLASDSYWQFWTGMLASGFRFDLMPTVFTTNTQFHPMHFWFLSELLQFLLLFALGHAVWRRWHTGEPSASETRASADAPPGRVSGRALLMAALAMTAIQAPISLLELRGGLFLGILQLQPMSWINHGVFFALGIYAHSRGWFFRLRPPGWSAFGALLAAMAGLGAIGFALYHSFGEDIPSLVFRLLGPLWMTIAGLWFLVVAVGLTHRYMNEPTAINTRLAQASYPTYLIHYPLILLFRLFLLTTDLPAPAKALIVFTLAASSSVFLGLYLMRARPRLAALALVGLHVLMLTVGLPRTSWSHLLLDRAPELHGVIPPQHPVHVTPDAGSTAGQPDGMTRSTPSVRVTWTAGRLYVAAFPTGLLAIDPDGVSTQLNSELELGALAPAPDGLWAIDRSTFDLVVISPRGHMERHVIDSASTPGPLWHLAATRGGGVFFSAGEGDSSGVYFLDAHTRSPRRMALLRTARGLALSADGRTLYAVAAGDFNVWAFDVGQDGELSNRRAVAELFRGDGRYGRKDLLRRADAAPEGMTVDRAGRLYITSRAGLQVFSAAGRLLGVVDFPHVPLKWDRIRPLTVTFGGPSMSTLYVTSGAQVFALTTAASG